MLSVPLYPQSDDHLCGPACLKMILQSHGIRRSERSLAEQAKTTWELGTSGENMVRVPKVYGLDAFFKDYSAIEDIRMCVRQFAIPVIVGWFHHIDGHYSVVRDIDEQTITMNNPLFLKPQTLLLKDFYRLWFDFDTAHIRTADDLILRRLFVAQTQGETAQEIRRALLGPCADTTLGVRQRLYRILKPEGVILSETPGKFVGWKPRKIFGTPDCPSGKRQMKRENRVFFHSYDDALSCNYRPCKVCKPVPER